MATQCPEKDTEVEPEPVNIQMPLQPDQHSARTTEDPDEHTEVEPEPVNTQSHLEPELTLKPWLQPETGTNEAETKSAEEVITNVLLSMNQDEQDQDGNQNQQQEDQDQAVSTPEAVPVSIEEKCFIWATTDNGNKYDIIFQLRGPNTLEAMRYNFMTMAPKTCIDMVMVSLVCHILNRE
ncbi:hypothetical protein PIB30_011832 [Stylosanthes scabra]|uniref:Uncharacterized protein n=1 Tax=Stylosanthes scabra TaxID=79078 RepID=A0ABU6S5Z3_9FABA|nr:hypothetical protein [Stylosanthes scabra]